MLLWKIVNNRLVKAENMTEEEALAAGYKPLEWTPEPDDGKAYQDGWADGTNTIVRTWTLMPDPKLDDADALNILLGGAT